MKLLRLTLQGFKSFADKTTIEFADGMTVIVGPNGCGKSNISDAVRWVLGEQNVRNLRGQKAEDIIFSGSESRQAKNGAEVTLVLDNSAHELPLDTTEVSITRRLLRNGDSDFKINKRSCRLKDIQELLANTGLGRGSLAIIGQNRVDQVLTARPDERRLIFEDVAGISLYRMRKNEGLRKLEKTAENMDRVQDMVALLDEQLVPLKEGAEKAKVYKELMKKKRALSASMTVLKLTSIGRMLSRYETEYRNLEEEDVKWETALSSFAAEREKLEKQALDFQENLRNLGQKTAEAQQKMEELRGDFRVKEESLHHGEEKKGELAAAEEDQKEAEEELAEEIRSGEEEYQSFVNDFRQWNEKKEKAEEEKKTLEEALAGSEAAYAEKLKVNRQKISEKQRLEQELSHVEEELRRLGEERAEALSSLAEKKKQLEELEKELAAQVKEEKESALRLQELEEQGKKDSLLLKQEEDRRFALMNEKGKQESALSAIRSRKNYLERAEKEYADFSMAVKNIMAHRELFGNAIHGPLGELVEVPEKYTAAAEVALGSRISCIVTDTTEAAGKIIGWLKERRLGRATFFPLESMKPSSYAGQEREAAGERGICGIASELLTCDGIYRDLLTSLLGRTLIAETLDDARRVAKKYRYRLRIVTLDGQLVNAGGSMTGGSMKKTENTFFGRKQEIRRLEKEEAEGGKTLEACKKQLEEQGHTCDSLARKVMEEREEWQSLKVSLASLTARREGMEKTLSDLKKAAGEEEELKEKREKELAEGGERKVRISEDIEKLADIPEILEDVESGRLKKKLDEKNEEILAIHVSLTKARESLSFGDRMKEDRERALKEQKADREKLEEDKKENERLLRTLQVEMEKLKEDFQKAEALWQDCRQNQSRLQDDSDKFAMEQKKLEESWRKTQEASSKVKRDMAERQGRIDNFKAQEEEEMRHLAENHMTRAEAEAIRLPGSMQDMRREEEKLSGKLSELGSVNPNGEEDYQKQLDKRKFYEEQIEDLTKARNGLETVIRDIDKTMTEQFGEAFKQINQEFGRIMQLMFQGGKARLELTDEAHPLEGGVEMYLQLPGKKRQPLTLMSGGERALTVIALLISFMAYRPAPFCFVDEIDAALDDANVERYSRMIADYKKKTQFIVISHRKKTMEFADTLQGVTMAEKGVSSLITVKMKDYVE
jgi:chromosome segregation protein